MRICNRQHSNTCSVAGCDRPYKARGWCRVHYERWRVRGSPYTLKKLANGTHETCTIAKCDKTHRSRGWCTMHWTRWSRYGDPLIRLKVAQGEFETCTIDGCPRPYKSKGLCHIHYNSLIAKPKRRVLQRGAALVDFTPDQWQQTLEDHKYRCAYCGTPDENLTQDHVMPISKGGNHTASNIVPACRSCNAKKSDSMGKYIPRAVIV